jgi:hypothetical protein
MMTVVRVGFIRCKPELFGQIRQMMQDSLPVLEPGIKRLPGLIHFYAGENEADLSFTNVSIWTSMEAARQMDSFEPMLNLARQFTAAGATLIRPIINYAQQWEIVP